MKGQPLKLRRMLLLPAVLTVLGIIDLTGSSAPHLTSKDIAFLVVSVAISAVLGAARGVTVELYPQQGELWLRYRWITVGLWIALLAAKLILIAIASAAGEQRAAGPTPCCSPSASACWPKRQLSVPGPARPGCPSRSATRAPTADGPVHPGPGPRSRPVRPPWPRPGNARRAGPTSRKDRTGARKFHHPVPPMTTTTATTTTTTTITTTTGSPARPDEEREPRLAQGVAGELAGAAAPWRGLAPVGFSAWSRRPTGGLLTLGG